MAHVLKNTDDARCASAARNSGGLAGFNLNDLADEGRMRLQECRNQMRTMIEEAVKEAELIRAQAEQRGYEEGTAKAAVDNDRRIMEEAEVRSRDGMQRLTQTVHELHRTYENWMTQYADSLSTMAIAAAERVVLSRLDGERELLVRWADEALRGTRSASRLTIAVHPETLAELGDALDQLLSNPDLPEQTSLEPDESVDRNSVVIRQPGGEINAGLPAQLRRLEEMLL